MATYFEKELLSTSMGSLSAIENKGVTISQDLVIKNTLDQEQTIMNLYATVDSGKSINLSMSIIEPNLVKTHIELIQPQVSEFINKINELNSLDGMPQILTK